jgi:isoleucyl-tRNA synthetase
MHTLFNEVSAVSPVQPSPATAVKAAAPQFNLRLNQPAFWNTPNPPMEETLLAHWRSLGVCDVVRDARAGADTFWLLDGPPYANGEAHLGHLLNKTLKDVNARFQSALGKQVVWRAGWDTHGLPLELAVEKRHGPGAKDNPATFMAACRAEASTWQQAQATSMARLGLVADLDNPWLTMDPPREASALGLLKEFWDAGLLVERHSPVHWCPACQSALAASELEKADKTRTEAFFLAELAPDSAATLAAQLGVPAAPFNLMSWTTTPWTLWANAAFAHPPAGAVALVTLASGKVTLMAAAARDAFVARHPELVRDAGYDFDGKLDFADLPQLALVAVSPLSRRHAPVLAAGFASVSEGAGFVHVAPAFGPEDFGLHETDGVRLECHVAPNGRLVTTDRAFPLPTVLEGLTLEAATDVSCALLQDSGMLVHSALNTVEAQMCWRHKKATFYRASQQWALDLHAPFEGCPEGLAARATAALDATQFVPDNRARAPLATMLATRRFWTLSRDRLWGLPLPFFRHEHTDALHPDTGAMWDALVAQVRVQGVEAWQSVPTPAGYRKTTQTVDVWFDSGAAWLSASEGGRHQPDMGVEGRDQTRGWFLSSYLLHAFKSAEPAFATLMTHSFVVGEDGLKLSKSKGGAGGANAMTPASVFAKEGADAFRLWVAAQNVGDESRWGRTALKQASQDLKDWRSFLRFLLANMRQAPNAGPAAPLQPLDQLALQRAARARQDWTAHMAAGRFNQAMQTLNGFRLWASTEWFELNKRTLYCARDDDTALLSLQWTLQVVFELFCRLLAPVLPFAAEEAYLAWPVHPDVSVFVGTVPQWGAPETDAVAAVEAALAWRRGLLPLVEKARALVEKGVPVAMGFGGQVPAGFDDEMLRAWFPNTYPRQEAVAADFAEHVTDTEYGVCAGRAAPAYAPFRCPRCRGYFAQAFGSDSLCTRCESEH